MGWAEGKGEKKAKTRFCVYFFYILHREGYLQAGIPPRATFWGPRVPRCPLPFLGWTLVLHALKRAPTLPRAKRQGSQVVGRGLVFPFWRGPGLSMSKGDGHLGNLSRTETGDEGLTDPTSTQSLGGR